MSNSPDYNKGYEDCLKFEVAPLADKLASAEAKVTSLEELVSRHHQPAVICILCLQYHNAQQALPPAPIRKPTSPVYDNVYNEGVKQMADGTEPEVK